MGARRVEGRLTYMKEMPNLDVLRSIAVVLVVVEHTLIAMHVHWIGSWNIAWLGVVGVFMFFVHTSLVLMWSLERDPHVLGFYTRRAFRIYPLAVLVLLLSVVFRIPSLHDVEGHTFFQMPKARILAENMLLVQNIHGGLSIWGVMWSLPYEIQMYVLLPFIFFFVRQNFFLWPILFLWAATVDYSISAFHLQGDGSISFLVSVPYFLAGVIAYILFSRVKPRLPWFGLPVAVAVLLCCFMPWPSWRAGWPLTLALGLLLPSFKQVQSTWIVRSSHAVAKYSYGIYLLHPISILIGVNLMQAHNLVLRLSALLLSLAVMSVAAHHLVEQPMIRLGSSLAKRMQGRSREPTPAPVAG